jgi:predicted Zn finger-like uncharacterized protein
LLIRCERCSTLYELDDRMLSPEGSPVQCARCQHVFTVRPPQAPGQTLQGLPAQEPPPAPPPPASPSESSARPTPPPVSATGAAQAGHRPAVYRPPPSHPAMPAPSVTRAPVIRRDTVGTFESRLRWSHRWKWLAPTLLVAVAGAVAALVLLRGAAVEERARRAHERALTLAAADDVQSLEQARREVEQALRASPRLHAVRADGALIDLLLAGALAEAPGEKGEQQARRERSRELVEAAGQALEELQRANVARPQVARARALAAAFGASRAELHRLAEAAEHDAPGDPWPVLAEASVDVRAGDKAVRDRALGELEALIGRRPELQRARYLLARGQALAGRRGDALATLATLLRVNPRHESALALQGLVSRPPSSAPVAPPVTTATAGTTEVPAKPEKAAALPRKPDATPPGGGDAAPAASGPVEPTGPGDVPPAPELPRLRPAAVPEPQPVRGGG